ncbi:carbonic anhydrase [Leminorella grimontii]|uniref:carbonic anhydrase n=1 Tax=Leminorella grimontii TaxID=82981 RepID=UPI0020837870|nr:carbonic anhydrase [Leminorella grimontii]GKX60101.1 carbonic anhydrase [Leminorella grimontii]
MKKLVIACGLALSFNAFASGHWGYSGEEGPEHWAELSPEFSACHAQNQSPVNLTGAIKASMAPFKLSYKAGAKDMVNNGHTLQVDYAPGSFLEIDGIRFELKQFHFHTPSENLIEGQSFPMEIHFVHASEKGEITVLAVMVKEGKENPTLAALWKEMPKEGAQVDYQQSVNAQALLPKGRHYYRFNGSLTTPPCTEGVRWLVLKDPIAASKAQIASFEKTMGHPNSRPVQPINARDVLKD